MANKIGLYLLIVLYFAAGINHFWHPEHYLNSIPDYLPAHEMINKLAGAAELLLAVLVFFTLTRKIGAYGIVLMLLAFIPAHITYIQHHPYGSEIHNQFFMLGLVRLFLVHPVLIAWAWWCRNQKNSELQIFSQA